MKLSTTKLRALILQFLILLVFVNNAHASAQNILDKKVNITTEKIEIRKLLREIQKQTGVEFIYSSDVIKVNNASVTELKNACDDALKRVSNIPFPFKH